VPTAKVFLRGGSDASANTQTVSMGERITCSGGVSTVLRQERQAFSDEFLNAARSIYACHTSRTPRYVRLPFEEPRSSVLPRRRNETCAPEYHIKMRAQAKKIRGEEDWLTLWRRTHTESDVSTISPVPLLGPLDHANSSLRHCGTVKE